MMHTTTGRDLIARYNYTWLTPGRSAADAMPVGNGDLAAGVYIENDALCLLLAKNDALDAHGNLVKIGRVRLSFTPSVLAATPFRQTLDIAEACLRIDVPGVRIRVWVDANRPLFRVNIDADHPIALSAEPEFWPRHDGQPDTVATADHAILWHRTNLTSDYPKHLKYYNIESLAASHPDPLLHRTMGALIEGDGLRLSDGPRLTGTGRSFEVRIASVMHQSADLSQWLARLHAARAIQAGDWDRHTQWWAAFWDRSWITCSDSRLPPSQRERADLVTSRPERTDPDGGFVVAQHYNVHRYMMACQSRGTEQVQFNGGLFTTPIELSDPAHSPPRVQRYGEDDRMWGRRYTFQNQRLMYWPMLAAGDFDLIHTFFNHYDRILDLRAAITREWFGHDGAYFRENLQICGDEIDDNGLTNGLENKPPRDNLPAPRVRGWHHYHFNAGLELPYMMLQYYRHTLDPAFRDTVLLPFARACLRFWDLHYQRDASGRLLLEPSQVLETYWVAFNPAQDIAGLEALLGGLLELPELSPTDRADWSRLRSELPPLPMREADGRTVIAPAESYSQIENAENGELYPLFPFDRVGVALGSAALARDTMAFRTTKDAYGHRCWTQDQIHFAYAGMAEEALAGLEHRFRQTSPAMRFPMYAREFPDHVPDFDHNGSGSIALQKMLLQESPDGQIHLLPAWPRTWDVTFKLHASRNTIITARVEAGVLREWTISPQSRANNVIVHTPQ